MAKDFRFQSSVQGNGGLAGGVDFNTGEKYYAQDVSAYQKKAKEDREYAEYYGQKKDGYRKVATIPDSLAIKILQDHGLNLHDPAFMSDPNNMKKLKQVLITEYRDLVINT